MRCLSTRGPTPASMRTLVSPDWTRRAFPLEPLDNTVKRTRVQYGMGDHRRNAEGSVEGFIQHGRRFHVDGGRLDSQARRHAPPQLGQAVGAQASWACLCLRSNLHKRGATRHPSWARQLARRPPGPASAQAATFTSAEACATPLPGACLCPTEWDGKVGAAGVLFVHQHAVFFFRRQFQRRCGHRVHVQPLATVRFRARSRPSGACNARSLAALGSARTLLASLPACRPTRG